MAILVDLTATKKDLRAKDKELKDALSKQKKLQEKVESLEKKLTEQVEYINVGTYADIYPHCIHNVMYLHTSKSWRQHILHQPLCMSENTPLECTIMCNIFTIIICHCQLRLPVQN